VAILGAGNIAGGYDETRRAKRAGIFTHAGAYRAHGGFELATVYDVSRPRAREFQRRWSVRHVAASLEEVVHGFHDVVSVCTPDKTHYAIAKRLLHADCCRVVFLEKPAASRLREIAELQALSRAHGIPVVVNFQRRFDPVHARVRAFIRSFQPDVLAGHAYYVRGLEHVGITLVDTLIYLCGVPRAVAGLRRVARPEGGDSLDFAFHYDGFSVSAATADSTRLPYCYHIFEIDLLFADRRLTLLDNSRHLRILRVGRFAYGGVRALADLRPRYAATGFDTALPRAAAYVHGIASGRRQHTVNTLADSYQNRIILDRIRLSHRRGSRNVSIPEAAWKK